MTYEINYNSQFSSYEITFDGKPSEAVRDALKALKFRWHSVKRCWYGYGSCEESIAAAITGSSTEEEPATVIGDGYLGGGAIYGSKSNRYLHGADLSAAIRQDLKKAGIKGATVKCKTYTGGQSLTVTVKMVDTDYIPFTQFLDSYRIKGNQYWINTRSGCIHCDKYWAADADEQERIRCEAAELEYISITTQDASRRIGSIDFLTTEALERVKLIDRIVAAYRYDCSNAMVDYFDTNFYYDIVLKPSAV